MMREEGFPSKKGKLSDFVNDATIALKEIPTQQLELAYVLQDKPVVCKKTHEMTPPTLSSLSTTIDELHVIEMTEEQFVADFEYVDQACMSFSNMSDQQDDFRIHWRAELDGLW